MSDFKLTDVEQQLIKRYQINKDPEIPLYFFNKIGKDMLNVIYSKVNFKFTNIPFEKEDLMSFVWKGIKDGLVCYKNGDVNIWTLWYKKIYDSTLKEIKKYFKNSEMVLNVANSWDKISNTHIIYKTARAIVEEPKESFNEILKPIVDYVVNHTKNYSEQKIKQLLLLKSFGYSEREIAKKMHTSRRYVTSLIKIIIRISRQYFKH